MKKVNQIFKILIFTLVGISGCSKDEINSEQIDNDQSIKFKKPDPEPVIKDVYGIYNCLNCDDLGLKDALPTDIVKFIGISTEDNTNFTVEIEYRGKTYSSLNNTLTNCNKTGKISTCDFAGSIIMANQYFSYQGIYQFREANNSKQECYSFIGFWDGSFSGIQINGTFESNTPLCQ